MIDNFAQISTLLQKNSRQHPDPDIFWFLDIIRRKKDNPDHPRNMNVLKTFYIKGGIDLQNKKDDIIAICNIYNARAYIRLNHRSFKRTALETMKLLAGYIVDCNYEAAKSAFNSAAGRYHSDPNKKWIIDIDGDIQKRDNIQYTINTICYEDKNWKNGDPIIDIIQTKNGWHLITKPFNPILLKLQNPEIDIHKDNPTILYIP